MWSKYDVITNLFDDDPIFNNSSVNGERRYLLLMGRFFTYYLFVFSPSLFLVHTSHCSDSTYSY